LLCNMKATIPFREYFDFATGEPVIDFIKEN